ncbi:MAG TPA: peptidylprolyl isomerase [Holophagaceae bacterium]|nr:peptidylprolyl isomerase [Holophagaceae bacterium]
MRLRPLSFHIAALSVMATLPAQAKAGTQRQAPHFTARDAVRAEWMRQAPAFSAEALAKLPAADRARYERTVARIGRPGAPPLLPVELAHPTQGIWDQKAEEAKTPRERFDALFFLNRFKDPHALKALDGLTPVDAKTWPKHLHLEAQIATARLNGAEVSPALQAFLDALQKAGKVDPIRAQAARLRLVMAGKEKELLPAIPFGTASTLALLDALRPAPENVRKDVSISLLELVRHPFSGFPEEAFKTIGIAVPHHELAVTNIRWWEGMYQRICEELPAPLPDQFPKSARTIVRAPFTNISTRLAIASVLQKATDDKTKLFAQDLSKDELDPRVQGALLPSLRVLAPLAANSLRDRMLINSNPIARSAAIEDLPAPPADLDELTKRTWADDQFESQQSLIQSYARWKMAPEEQKAQLRPWLQHPNWSCRFEAYQALVKLDPTTPWPEAPTPTATEEKILQEAGRLAERGRPVRLRITFSGHRQVTMRLDPTVAPINVANLELLAKQRFFDGHLVPRVVPDFVVQMGSPFDTMDGGPGYTVRCEDSLDWYGPGSVGMALAGKDTGGCQFFITTNATPHLTGKYTRVGQVEDLDHAMKVLDDLELGAKIESIRVVQ